MANLVRIVRRHLLRLSAIGEVNYPIDHLFGLRVPKGGSDCSKCKYLSKDSKHCGNEFFQDWRASLGHTEDSALIPYAADEYCCDVFEQMP
jgi:hypothetical protein